jgi:hypothetical protein
MDRLVLQQFLRLPRVFARNQIRFFQHANRSQRNIFQVSDRRGHQIQASGLRIVLSVRHFAILTPSLACGLPPPRELIVCGNG